VIARSPCDILASDYCHPAMLGAIVRLHADGVALLPALWRLVSGTPANAMGLPDRARIAAGLRADLVLRDWPEGHAPTPVRTWAMRTWVMRTWVSGRGGSSSLALPRMPETAR